MSSGSQIAILAPRVVREAPRRWRKRGRFRDLSALDDTALLARAFGLDDPALPAAPLHYLGITGREPEGYCLFAYPVHLHVRREQLILMTGPEFEPSEAEARSLMSSLRDHFTQWRIERTSDDMWFIMTDEDPELETTALQDVLGENINDHLPRGGDAMEWHRLMNEMQMVLFDSEVNRKREEAGQPPVNSLWFWGGGRLPDLPAPHWRRVVSDDPVALGMGRRANLECRRLSGQPPGLDIDAPDTLWIHGGTPGGAGAPLSSGQWQTLRGALQQREIEELVLIEPGRGELRVRSAEAASWWRRW